VALIGVPLAGNGAKGERMSVSNHTHYTRRQDVRSLAIVPSIDVEILRLVYKSLLFFLAFLIKDKVYHLSILIKETSLTSNS
jgi:hypothetical protein